jgi:hypothetical protein
MGRGQPAPSHNARQRAGGATARAVPAPRAPPPADNPAYRACLDKTHERAQGAHRGGGVAGRRGPRLGRARSARAAAAGGRHSAPHEERRAGVFIAPGQGVRRWYGRGACAERTARRRSGGGAAAPRRVPAGARPPRPRPRAQFVAARGAGALGVMGGGGPGGRGAAQRALAARAGCRKG